MPIIRRQTKYIWKLLLHLHAPVIDYMLVISDKALIHITKCSLVYLNVIYIYIYIYPIGKSFKTDNNCLVF